ncbi:Sialidase family [Penicillium vulpinum]|uniref:Sialidase domain-containing protein n=1 Tax=Penicillium vulpinum TaxID=29845 RepID=A0A1V6R5G1_9EURO|nr:Sialidase family [Penicillium vulpinum]KAJ5965094.1 Sialidase family [Penicillium vulpinum]OQD96754.1 hypothetical protein PENVUL_c088G03255 [Penicillium vulpinum]
MTLRSIIAAIGLHALAAVALPAQPTAEIITQHTLTTNGEGLFPYYRIVGLANLGNGTILAAFDGRPNNGDSPAPNSILQRRSEDGGETWGEVTYIARGQIGNSTVQQYGFSDPSYVFDENTGNVFNFHVFSKNQGFAGSALGTDDTNLSVMSAEVSISTDRGVTWSTDPANQPLLPPIASEEVGAPPLLTTAVKPVGSTVNGVANVGGVRGTFATSGEGIQLKYGTYAGRLVQQYIGNVIQADGSTSLQAYSVFSDNGGQTWKMGQPQGTEMSENKVVELSNGNLMLNSRPNSRGYRKVAISTDGGETYSVPTIETQLPDPSNNGAITRMYPQAPEGSASAKILLFTNSNHPQSRVNGTVRYSCDDGTTWSSGRVFEAGETQYSTITALDDDMFGIFYEGPSNDLIFLKVSKDYIGVSC